MEKKLLLTVKETVITDRKCLVIEANGEPIIKVIPNETVNGFLLLDNSPNRVFNKYLIDEKYEHRIEISPDRLSENLWDSLGISYVPEENMLKITTISEVGRDKDIKYCIPVGSMWAVEYLKTSLVSSVDWYSGEMWLNLFEKRV